MPDEGEEPPRGVDEPSTQPGHLDTGVLQLWGARSPGLSGNGHAAGRQATGAPQLRLV